MFGAYRFFLALLVVTQHLGGFHVLGAYAVFGFYILSGYLMTSIMQRNYGYSVKGILSYGLNRILRIYPIYWISILVSAALILYWSPAATVKFHEAIFMPRDAYEWFKNIFIFFPVVESPRFTPPAWALTVELFFYVLIGLGLSKNKFIVAFWLVASAGYHLFANLLDLGWASIYFSVAAASLPFATGAFIFHYKEQLLNVLGKSFRFEHNLIPTLGCGLIVFNWWLGDVAGLVQSFCFYVNYFLCALVLLILTTKKTLFATSPALDQWLGGLSYPVYLIHYQMGFITLIIMNGLGFSVKRPELGLLLCSLPLIIGAAWALMILVERPIERIRSTVRPVSLSAGS